MNYTTRDGVCSALFWTDLLAYFTKDLVVISYYGCCVSKIGAPGSRSPTAALSRTVMPYAMTTFRTKCTEGER